MGLTEQVLFALALGAGCAALHIAVVAAIVPALKKIGVFFDELLPGLKIGALLIFAFFAVTLSHIAQILIWAVVLIWLEAFADLNQALYFSIVTYTTVGYGDVVLADGLRIFGALESFTGLLAFGISTAFFLGVIVNVLSGRLTDSEDQS